jgi:hypothetical protein
MQDIIIVGGVSDVDSELYVRLDHYQQERDDDITGRPDFEPVTAAGPKFYPLQLQQRPAVLAAILRDTDMSGGEARRILEQL